MCMLKKILINRTEEDRTLSKRLADALSCTTSVLTKFKKPDKELDSFETLIGIVKFLEPDKEQDVMVDYSKYIDPNKKTARLMLEYLACNRLLEAMSDLLERMELSGNKESKMWAKTYRYLYIWLMDTEDKLNLDDYLNSLNNLNVESIPLLKNIKNILKCYVLIQKQFHKQVCELSYEINAYIDTMEEGFLHNVYKVRLNEILSIVNLWVLYDCENARLHANRVLETDLSTSFNAYAHLIIGRSYFFTSYTDSKDNLIKSKELYRSVNRLDDVEGLNILLESLDIFWNQKDNTAACLCIENELYFKVKRTNVNIDAELSEGSIDPESPFYYLLKGMNENNKETLFKSMVLFLKNGDTFNSNFAKIELLDRGFSEIMLNELIKIHSI